MPAKARTKIVLRRGMPFGLTIGDRTITINGLAVLDPDSDVPLIVMTFDQLDRLARELIMAPPPGPTVVKSVTRNADNRIVGAVDRTVTTVNIGA